jgi:hypothetical protein
MSCETAERIRLEALMSDHVKKNPTLKGNALFWKLVEQCADTIAFATNAGQELTFVTSHSGFGSPRNAVFLMIGDAPFGISVDDSESNHGRFHVLRAGIEDGSIETSEDLLALVKQSIE